MTEDGGPPDRAVLDAWFNLLAYGTIDGPDPDPDPDPTALTPPIDVYRDRVAWRYDPR